MVKELRVYSMLKCLKTHCNYSFAQQCPYSYFLSLFITTKISKAENNITNRCSKALIKSGKKILTYERSSRV